MSVDRWTIVPSSWVVLGRDRYYCRCRSQTRSRSDHHPHHLTDEEHDV